MIRIVKGKHTYFDINGIEVKAGDTVLLNGREQTLYLLASCEPGLSDKECNLLGTDATNPAWIANGRAAPCEYGCYTLQWDDDFELVRCGNE